MSEEATATARKILNLREQHRGIITTEFGRAAANGHRILESLYAKPIVSVKEAQQVIGSSYQTANDIISKLTDLQILSEMTGLIRNRIFRYSQYVDLFSNGTEHIPQSGA